MTLTSWLGLGFIALLLLTGLTAVVVTLRSISQEDIDDSAKAKWGALIGLSPGAGLYAWHRRKDLMGHRSLDDESE